MERDLGEQPIKALIESNNLDAKDLVTASSEGITFKMVSRACKGRRLTPHVQQKICNALKAASGKDYDLKDLFSY